MLVTPSSSVRTVKPATAVANHRKQRRRENAGRSSQIALYQGIHSDIAPPVRCCQHSIACVCYTYDKQTPRADPQPY